MAPPPMAAVPVAAVDQRGLVDPAAVPATGMVGHGRWHCEER
jgi:hypothetical protein